MDSYFPCRACGLPTEGVDSFVICSDCALDFELRFRESRRDDAEDQVPITGEIEARLRRLVDNW